jgi:hypothetical protein
MASKLIIKEYKDVYYDSLEVENIKSPKIIEDVKCDIFSNLNSNIKKIICEYTIKDPVKSLVKCLCNDKTEDWEWLNSVYIYKNISISGHIADKYIESKLILCKNDHAVTLFMDLMNIKDLRPFTLINILITNNLNNRAIEYIKKYVNEDERHDILHILSDILLTKNTEFAKWFIDKYKITKKEMFGDEMSPTMALYFYDLETDQTNKNYYIAIIIWSLILYRQKDDLKGLVEFCNNTDRMLNMLNNGEVFHKKCFPKHHSIVTLLLRYMSDYYINFHMDIIKYIWNRYPPSKHSFAVHGHLCIVYLLNIKDDETLLWFMKDVYEHIQKPKDQHVIINLVIALLLCKVLDDYDDEASGGIFTSGYNDNDFIISDYILKLIHKHFPLTKEDIVDNISLLNKCFKLGENKRRHKNVYDFLSEILGTTLDEY